MPTRIRVLEGIVPHIRIAIQTLRVAGVGHNRIRADKAPYHGIVPPRAVKVQPGGYVKLLPGVRVVRDSRNRYFPIPRFSVRPVTRLAVCYDFARRPRCSQPRVRGRPGRLTLRDWMRLEHGGAACTVTVLPQHQRQEYLVVEHAGRLPPGCQRRGTEVVAVEVDAPSLPAVAAAPLNSDSQYPLYQISNDRPCPVLGEHYRYPKSCLTKVRKTPALLLQA